MGLFDVFRRAAKGRNARPGWESANPGGFTFAAGQARGPKKGIPGLKAGRGGQVQQRDFGARPQAAQGARQRPGAGGMALPIADARAAALRGRQFVGGQSAAPMDTSMIAPEVRPLDYSQFETPAGTPLPGGESVGGQVLPMEIGGPLPLESSQISRASDFEPGPPYLGPPGDVGFEGRAVVNLPGGGTPAEVAAARDFLGQFNDDQDEGAMMARARARQAALLEQLLGR